MKTPVVAGNWKMNNTVAEAAALVNAMIDSLGAVQGVEVVLCPPYTAIEAVGGLLDGTGVGLGAQDIHYEARGAFTGEVSASMAAELCRYVIIGHSERRQLFGETDEVAGRKVEAALAAGLRPILCVGETLEERESGVAEGVVERQVQAGLVRASFTEGLIVAYEPVWAIGTGRAASPEDAQAMMSHVRAVIAGELGEAAANATPLLYGGSVNPDNVDGFARQPDVDGALVGGASLEAESFVRVVQGVAAAVA